MTHSSAPSAPSRGIAAPALSCGDHLLSRKAITFRIPIKASTQRRPKKRRIKRGLQVRMHRCRNHRLNRLPTKSPHLLVSIPPLPQKQICHQYSKALTEQANQGPVDDEEHRECKFCKASAFTAVLICSCQPDKTVCLKHYDKLCAHCTPRQMMVLMWERPCVLDTLVSKLDRLIEVVSK